MSETVIIRKRIPSEPCAKCGAIAGARCKSASLDGATVSWTCANDGLYADGDWMLECDDCGKRMAALESLRGTKRWGLEVAREIARQDGWHRSPENGDDLCPTCPQPLKGEK